MTDNLQAIQQLLALIKESPDLVSELSNATSQEELAKSLSSKVADAEAKALREKRLASLKKTYGVADPEKALKSVDTFVKSFTKTFKVKEETPLSRRWNVTITNGDYKVNIVIHESKAHETPDSTPAAE